MHRNTRSVPSSHKLLSLPSLSSLPPTTHTHTRCHIEGGKDLSSEGCKQFFVLLLLFLPSRCLRILHFILRLCAQLINLCKQKVNIQKVNIQKVNNRKLTTGELTSSKASKNVSEIVEWTERNESNRGMLPVCSARLGVARRWEGVTMRTTGSTPAASDWI